MIYFGIVEDRKSDPLMIGRCKVRVFGIHTDDKALLPTEDLPWATPLQSITSAASAGIGVSPTGLIEGQWVAITFTDEDQQIPVILGSIAGFKGATTPPPPVDKVDANGHLQSQDGTVVTDSYGNPITTGSDSIATTNNVPKVKQGEGVEIFDPSSLSTSAEGKQEIKNHEGLSSVEKGKNRITTLPALVKKYGTDLSKAKLYAYKDTVGKWTIGYGQTYLLDGQKVTEATELTYPEAEQLFEKKLKKEFEAGVKRNLKVKVTQSMFDTLVSLAYNAGVGGLINSEVWKLLQSGFYTKAGEKIATFKTNDGSLSSRRLKEQAMFFKDGVPETTDEINAANAAPTASPAPAPITRRKDIRADGKQIGQYSGESEVNRLARNRKYSQTVKELDDNSRKRNVISADGSFWQQPASAYGATYPHNHVYVTESGHIQEFDDSAGYERIQTRHKTGTFTEIDYNGTQVNKIVGDSYTVIDRHGFISIEGNCHITIVGNANLNVQNNANVTVQGNLKAEVSGKADILQTGAMTLGSKGQLSIHSTDIVAIQGKEIHFNTPGKVKAPTYRKFTATGDPTFEPLVSISSKQGEVNSSFEAPEEGDNSSYVEKNLHKFDIPDIAEIKGEEKESKTPTPNPRPTTVQCENLSDSEVVSSYKLTEKITLGRLLQRGESGYPQGKNYGKTASEIVCNLKKLAVNCLDPILETYPSMIVTSAWRQEVVNKKVRGQETSDHLTGCAVDIQIPSATRDEYLEIAEKIASQVKDFKQIILEYKGGQTWIHISYKEGQNGREILTMDASINKVIGRGKFVRFG